MDTHGVRSTFFDLEPVVTTEDIGEMISIARGVTVSQSVKTYIVDLVEGTRNHSDILLGASPRSALFLQRLSRARAASEGREYVTPDDVKSLANPVLVHRMSLRPEAQMRGETLDEVIQEVMTRLRVPGTTTRLAT